MIMRSISQLEEAPILPVVHPAEMPMPRNNPNKMVWIPNTLNSWNYTGNHYVTMNYNANLHIGLIDCDTKKS